MDRGIMSARRGLAYRVATLGIVALGHELALGMLVEHDMAGALLAGGGGWVPWVATLGTLALRMAVFVLVVGLPAVAVYRALGHRTR
jgi:hypothetical protein